jgi:hypothetical protein
VTRNTVQLPVQMKTVRYAVCDWPMHLRVKAFERASAHYHEFEQVQALA